VRTALGSGSKKTLLEVRTEERGYEERFKPGALLRPGFVRSDPRFQNLAYIIGRLRIPLRPLVNIP
jgi:hypothetical protein